MKYIDIKDKELSELRQLLKDKKTELFTLRIKLRTGQLTKPSEISIVRKDIARISTLPLPLPILTSRGFAVKGLSGNTRIHTLPALFTCRVIAILADSICLESILPCSSAFIPISPNAREFPRNDLPLFLPFICFLYFVFFGINMSISFYPLHENLLPHHVLFECLSVALHL